MNSDQLQGKWKEIKGSVKERWGKLTDDDISTINGQTDQLVGRIQQRYGLAKEDAHRQVDDWIRSHRGNESESDMQRRRAS